MPINKWYVGWSRGVGTVFQSVFYPTRHQYDYVTGPFSSEEAAQRFEGSSNANRHYPRDLSRDR